MIYARLLVLSLTVNHHAPGMEITPLIRKIIDLAIAEDLAMGDVTTRLTVEHGRRGLGRVVAREELVVCGLPLIHEIFTAAAWAANVKVLHQEGEVVQTDTVLAEVEGELAALLACERTVLNFLQRMSGVAATTRDLIRQAHGIQVLDTRKTIPGWRSLDKYAVRVGGGKNHRNNLGDMVLVKNNHVDAARRGAHKLSSGEKMRETLTKIWRENLSEGASLKAPWMPIEVEVRNDEELAVALEFEPTVVMLDNFDDTMIIRAFELIRQKRPATRVEVSGGITPERLGRLKLLGVDTVSVGRITTHAVNRDISMRIEPLV